MIINLTIDYNPETGECKVINSDQPKTKTAPKVNNETLEPQIILDSNKYILNQAAADLMHVKWEDRLDIKYQKVKGVTYPIIGTDVAFGTKGGNKLTKGLSVSCRGKANEMLARYGKVFTLAEYKGHPDLYVLIGDSPVIEQNTVDNIEVKEDDDHVDLPLDVELVDEQVEKIDEFSFNID